MTAWAILTAAVVITCGTVCQKKSSPIPQTSAVQTSDTKGTLGAFVPSADSSVTLAQVKCWIACNLLLDSLVCLYADSFKTHDSQSRLCHQEAFSSAQDKICIRSGLAGGYTEYRWIRSCMNLPRNKAVLDSAGIQAY